MKRLRQLFRPEPKRLDMAAFEPLPEDGVLVGGSVRDSLLGREVRDIDWLVPDPRSAAERAAATLDGSVFVMDPVRGHWRVVNGHETRDYAPLEGDLEANLRARDFTLNAMAATLEGDLIDPLDGQRDLAQKRLRMVSEANLRADPIRILRAVRFVVQLGLALEPQTRAAIESCAQSQRSGDLERPAWERVQDVFNQLLLSERAGQALLLIENLGMLELYLPELAKARGVEQGGFHHLDVLRHSFEALNQLVQGFPEAGLALRWAALLHDVGKADTKAFDETGRYHFYGHDKLGAKLTRGILRRFRYGSAEVTKASQLVRYHMLPLPKNEREARRFIHRRRELLPDLLKVMIADREAARGPRSSETNRNAYRLALARILKLMETPPPKAALLGGRDIMDLLDIEAGPRVGEALRFIKEAEAVGDISTRAEAKAALLHFAKQQGWPDNEPSVKAL